MAFESLTERLQTSLKSAKGKISDVEATKVRLAFLEADVALPG